MPVREKRPPRPVASRGGPYGKPGRTVGMRRPRRPRRGLAHAVFPIPAPNLELVGADGVKPPLRRAARSTGVHVVLQVVEAAAVVPEDFALGWFADAGEGQEAVAGLGERAVEV